jgi:hypothetical protein
VDGFLRDRHGDKLRDDMDKLSIVSKDAASAAVPFAARQPERAAVGAGQVSGNYLKRAWCGSRRTA